MNDMMQLDVEKIEQKKICDKCGGEKKLTANGNRKPYFSCRPCHAKDVREKYSDSRNRAVSKFSKTEKRKKWVAQDAIKKCGVASATSVRSKKSEKTATNARQLWTMPHDKMLMSGEFTQSELAKVLGRSIRAVQRRVRRLRDENNEI